MANKLYILQYIPGMFDIKATQGNYIIGISDGRIERTGGAEGVGMAFEKNEYGHTLIREECLKDGQ